MEVLKSTGIKPAEINEKICRLKNEKAEPTEGIKVSLKTDSFNSHELKTGKISCQPPVTFSEKNDSTIQKVKTEVKNNLTKAIMGGAAVKGAIFGAEYFAAGTVIGLGYEFKVLKFVPDVAMKAPALLGTKGRFARAAVTGLSAGVIGTGLGAAKGAADGFLAGVTDSKAFAVTSLAVTTGLLALPFLKVGKVFGTGAVVMSTASGAYYGAKLFDHAKKEQ